MGYPWQSWDILGCQAMSGAGRLGWWGSTAITNWYAFTRLAYGLLAGGVAQSWQPGQRRAEGQPWTTTRGVGAGTRVYAHTYMIITYDATI